MTDQLRERMHELVEKHHLPGLGVCVVRDGDVAFSEVINGTRSTRHRIASITKTWTALCAMRLVEEGRLSLDDSPTTLLPDIEFIGPTDAMTVRDLLRHTSGIGEAPHTDVVAGELEGFPVGERPAFIHRYPRGITIESEAGVRWAYANHGYAILGEIIAEVEGAAIEDVIAARVLEPLGMASSDVLDEPHPDLWPGHRRPESPEVAELWARVGRAPRVDPEPVDGHNIVTEFRHFYRAEGGGQSTLADLSIYARELLDEGARIVSRETFREMVTPAFSLDPALTSWGLGFGLTQWFGRRSFGHGGRILDGWLSHLDVFPDEGLGCVVIMNLDYEGWNKKVLAPILQAVLDASPPTFPRRPIPADVLRDAPGMYSAPPGKLLNFRVVTTTGRVTLRAEEGELVLQSQRGAWKDGVRLVATDDSGRRFVVDDPDDPDPDVVVWTGDALLFGDPIPMVRTPQR